jgi:amino acid transporter
MDRLQNVFVIMNLVIVGTTTTLPFGTSAAKSQRCIVRFRRELIKYSHPYLSNNFLTEYCPQNLIT